MSLPELTFSPWPKTPRLFRDMVITEKIDGTNAAVGIIDLGDDPAAMARALQQPHVIQSVGIGGRFFAVYAQSRKRLITPESDNFGFASWVGIHSALLVEELGPGLHFGEWWGSGIQRGYGLLNGERRFSLFNVHRYGDRLFSVPGLAAVPLLRQHTFSTDVIRRTLTLLKEQGSHAIPGFPHPEGIVVYHTMAGQVFKVTIDGDDAPKGAA